MKKNINLFSDDFNDFQPRKHKIVKNVKSKQVSLNELDYDDSYQPSKKKQKNVDYKRY